MKRQGIYTFIPKNAVLLRNKQISAPIRKPGRGGYVIAAASRLFFYSHSRSVCLSRSGCFSACKMLSMFRLITSYSATCFFSLP